MTFPEWAEAIVEGVRHYFPDARAVRKGPRLVFIRHHDLEARLEDDGSAFVITFRAGGAKTMSSLVDRDRRDAFTVSNLSHSVLMRARDSMSLSHRNAFSYKGSTFQVEQGKCAVPDGSFRRRKNRKTGDRASDRTRQVYRRRPKLYPAQRLRSDRDERLRRTASRVSRLD
jgi:hypothetical protein